MIPRILSKELKEAAKRYPVVTLTGPRQSGKTTLVKDVFKEYEYVSLELPDERAFALEDPKGFLKRFKERVILDEVQRVPELFSYIQVLVDEKNTPGRFILTGSQNFLLHEKISQSLAGRTALLYLLPFSKRELFREKPVHPDDFPSLTKAHREYPDIWELLFTGFYPRIHDMALKPQEWLSDYYQTYVERDVRSLINVGDLYLFERFLRLCAGRNGQLLNYSSLASDTGISVTTAKRWLSVLTTSFIVSLVTPHFENFRKRLVKSPRLYFLDTGLLTFLLGIRSPRELSIHSMRGGIFEAFVFSELYKMHVNQRIHPKIYFWRDVKNHEVDFIMESGPRLIPIEVKSGETITKDQLKGLKYYKKLAHDKVKEAIVIYCGKESYKRQDIQVLSWELL